MIHKRKHRTGIKYITPKTGEKFVPLSKTPFFWNLLTRKQKYNYHTRQNAYWTAHCLTPSTYEITSRLVQYKKIDMSQFDGISLQGIGYIHLPLSILKDLAHLNNLKCNWFNNDQKLKQENKFGEKIVKVSARLAPKLHKFIWNVMYYKYIELNDNEENEEKYIKQEEMKIEKMPEYLYDNLCKTFIPTDGYEWKH